MVNIEDCVREVYILPPPRVTTGSSPWSAWSRGRTTPLFANITTNISKFNDEIDVEDSSHAAG